MLELWQVTQVNFFIKQTILKLPYHKKIKLT